jgi:hypothetical protein
MTLLGTSVWRLRALNTPKYVPYRDGDRCRAMLRFKIWGIFKTVQQSVSFMNKRPTV